MKRFSQDKKVNKVVKGEKQPQFNNFIKGKFNINLKAIIKNEHCISKIVSERK